MKLLNEHKGIILVFIAMVLFVMWWSSQVEKHDKEMTAIKYVCVTNTNNKDGKRYSRNCVSNIGTMVSRYVNLGNRKGGVIDGHRYI